ncbi:MAG: hypothetical protein R2729_05375 [Bryobacteraceae bacterium]
MSSRPSPARRSPPNSKRTPGRGNRKPGGPAITLVHWNAEEAEEHAACLRAGGFEVLASSPQTPDDIRALRANPPAAYVISLDRMPSNGRYLGMSIRQRKALRTVPILFVGGAPEKVDPVRKLLPDATFTDWPGLPDAIRRAVASPPLARPAAPPVMAAYAARPLIAKLGIAEGTRVGLLGPPPGIGETLGDLPPGAHLAEWEGGRCNILFWFTRTLAEVEAEADWILARIGDAKLWIFWPKRSSGISSDVTPARLTAIARPLGWSTYKTLSFDATWSGMVFSRSRETK